MKTSISFSKILILLISVKQMGQVQLHGVSRKDHFVNKVKEAVSSKSYANHAYDEHFSLLWWKLSPLSADCTLISLLSLIFDLSIYFSYF